MALSELCLFLLMIANVKTHNILVTPFGLGASHLRSMSSIGNALARRGHNVTFWVSTYALKKYPISGSHTKKTHEEYNFLDSDDLTILEMGRYINNTELIKPVFHAPEPFTEALWWIGWKLSIDMCVATMAQHRESYEKLASQKWDLVISDAMFHACGLAFAKKAQTPLMPMCTTMLTPHMGRMKGAPLPIGAYPQVIKSTYDAQSFLWRLFMVYEHTASHGLNIFVNYMIKRSLASYASELENFDKTTTETDHPIMLTAFADELDFPKPKVHNVVPINVDCDFFEPSPLPEDLDHFVNKPGSKGTILLAFGTMVSWDAVPELMVPAILKTMSEMPDYQFIWQINIKQMPKASKNVFMTKWLPQHDVLVHPKTKVFVSHGGYKSVLEAMCAAKPILVLPFAAEQPRNGHTIENWLKVGRVIYKFDLTSEKLTAMLRDVAENPKYLQNSQKLREMFDDKPMNAHEWASFWIERSISRSYSILKSRAPDLNFVVLHSLDVITGILVAVYLAYRLLFYCFCKIFCSR